MATGTAADVGGRGLMTLTLYGHYALVRYFVNALICEWWRGLHALNCASDLHDWRYAARADGFTSECLHCGARESYTHVDL